MHIYIYIEILIVVFVNVRAYPCIPILKAPYMLSLPDPKLTVKLKPHEIGVGLTGTLGDRDPLKKAPF